MRIISLDQVGELEATNYITPFAGKRGGSFFLAHEVLNLREAIQEMARFEELSGLQAKARPLLVIVFRDWMADRLEEELAAYTGHPVYLEEERCR